MWRQSVVVDGDRSDMSAFGDQRAARAMVSGILEGHVTSVEFGRHREDTCGRSNPGQNHEIIRAH
jgi:hypothetical protein